MNKKGFTLVELLAVIIILSLLALLTSNAISSILRKSKNELYNTQIELIESTAKMWGASNISLLPESGECGYITIGDLKGLGLLDESLINPKTNKEFSDNMKIKASVISTEYGNLNTEYEITENVDGCKQIYKPVCISVNSTNATYDTENNLIGTIAKERTDYNTIKYKPGDEYICEVKDNTFYHFYVLSTNNKSNEIITNNSSDKQVASINLIMNQNINSDGTVSNEAISKMDNPDSYNVVDWVSNEDSIGFNKTQGNCDGGPVTAMNFLYNATKDWDKVSNMVINLDDEEFINIYGDEDRICYGGINTNTRNNLTSIIKKDGTTTAIYENLKSRMPYPDEFLFLYSYDNTEDFTWTYDYLQQDDRYPYSVSIQGMVRYWSLYTAYVDEAKQHYACTVDAANYIFDCGHPVDDKYTGVRPVITLKPYQIK